MKSIWWVALAAGSAAYSLVRQGKDVLPSFRGVAEVRSHLPGRLRLFIPAIARQEEAARTMKKTLEATGAVHSVTLNPRTATALICYDEAQVGAAVIEGAVIRLMALDAEIAHPTACRVAKGLKTGFGALDRGIREVTDGLFDARTLAGVALAAGGAWAHGAPRRGRAGSDDASLVGDGHTGRQRQWRRSGIVSSAYA